MLTGVLDISTDNNIFPVSTESAKVLLSLLERFVLSKSPLKVKKEFWNQNTFVYLT